MPGLLEKLQQFDNEKLIDIVKNYKLYGYEDNVRATALKLLNDRGLDNELLEATGSLVNHAGQDAAYYYGIFLRNASGAFIFYIILLLSPAVMTYAMNKSDDIYMFVWAISTLLVVPYYLTYRRAMYAQGTFYKTIGKEPLTNLLYITGGLFYFGAYPYFITKMKNELKRLK